MTSISNRKKGCEPQPDRPRTAQMSELCDDVNLSREALPQLALYVNGGVLRGLSPNPVRAIAGQVKAELQAFLREHRRLSAGPELGFQAENVAIEIKPLQQKLAAAADKLELVIAGGKPHARESIETRMGAVQTQASLEAFALRLETLSDSGELASGKLPEVLGGIIELKAELNAIMLNMEALQLKITEACAAVRS